MELPIQQFIVDEKQQKYEIDDTLKETILKEARDKIKYCKKEFIE